MDAPEHFLEQRSRRASCVIDEGFPPFDRQSVNGGPLGFLGFRAALELFLGPVFGSWPMQVALRLRLWVEGSRVTITVLLPLKPRAECLPAGLGHAEWGTGCNSARLAINKKLNLVEPAAGNGNIACN